MRAPLTRSILVLRTASNHRKLFPFAEHGTSHCPDLSARLCFWLFIAASLVVVVVAGKFLIDSNAVPNAAAAVVRAITQPVQSAKSQQLSLGTESDKKAASIAEPAFAKPQTVLPDHAEPQTAPPGRADPQTGLLDRSEPQLPSSQIRVLLERGDALVSRADIEAARLSYAQAVAAGNAEAAIRLGATYDPAFLAQARLRNVRGNATIAQYWYQRAHDLEQNPAQLSSSEARN
jgi:hypothetical protein